jgi:hypothetical protein
MNKTEFEDGLFSFECLLKIYRDMQLLYITSDNDDK